MEDTLFQIIKKQEDCLLTRIIKSSRKVSLTILSKSEIVCHNNHIGMDSSFADAFNRQLSHPDKAR